MINFKGKQYRNLEEQVLKNKDDIVIGWQPKLPPLINNELFPTKKQLFNKK